MTRIPFSMPYLTGKELTCVQEAAESGHWSGDGPFSKKCTDILAQLTGKQVFLTPSGTASLELALMSLDLNPGDEVILPSYTFVSTANAVVQMGLKPVFIDIRADTLNMDESLIEPAITEKTRAILVVHYAGVSAEMDAINAIAKRHGLFVVEDAAQGVNAFYKNRALGSLGDLGIFSFHQTKNFSSGEGGAIVVSNKNFLKAIEIHRQKGTDRSQFIRGEVDKYSWIDRGSNYLLSDLLAAFLYPQLQAMDEITNKRRALYHDYDDRLSFLSGNHFQLPTIPSDCRSNYHFFYILLEKSLERDRLISHLKESGVEATTHFVPLHNSKGGRKFGIVRGPMTVTNRVGDCLLRLPLYTQMTPEEQNHVVERLKSFFRTK